MSSTMRPSELLKANRPEILAIAKANHVSNVRCFGSSIRGEDGPGSDLDLLVDPLPEATLLDIARLQNGLQALLGIPVDVLTPRALPTSFRDKVMAEAIPV